jgi:hypothetical protein
MDTDKAQIGNQLNEAFEQSLGPDAPGKHYVGGSMPPTVRVLRSEWETLLAERGKRLEANLRIDGINREAIRLECVKAAVNSGARGWEVVKLAGEMFAFVTGEATRPVPDAVPVAGHENFTTSGRPEGSPPVADVVGCDNRFDPGWVDKLKTETGGDTPDRTQGAIDSIKDACDRALKRERPASLSDYTPDPSPES